MGLLNDEAELDEIVKLVGMDALSAPDRLKLEAARSIREDYLHQDAFHEVDTYTDLKKQYLMMELVLSYYDISLQNLSNGVSIDSLVKLPVRERIGRFKYVSEEKIQKEFEDIIQNIHREIDELIQKEEA
jgi:V/A-type H+-transporting ATPase subunit A